jgi:gluconate 2-dehydrogenase gamma chain
VNIGIAFGIAGDVVRQFVLHRQVFLSCRQNGIGRKNMGSGGMARTRIQDESSTVRRRGFLRTVVQVATAGPLTSRLMIGTAAATAVAAAPKPVMSQNEPKVVENPKLPAPEAGYECLGPGEASFVEAMVNVMCPADELTPGGVDCGLAVFIDRQLAGGYGKGERLYMYGPWKPGKPQQGYQLPLTPEQFFKVGLAAANEGCRSKLGKAFDELSVADADASLHNLAASNDRPRVLGLRTRCG